MRYSVTIAGIILVVIFIIGIYLIVNLYNKTDSGNNNGNNNLIIEYKKLRDGFFGISGVVKNKSYLSKLKVEIFRYGFFMGISEDIARHGKKIHDKNMRASVENGTMPMITLLAPEVVDENKTKEILRDIVLYYTIGEGAEKIGTPIVYWEIGNEVNGNWGTSCDADEYYNRVKVYASAIREACSNCKIVMGSLLDNIPGDRDLEVYLERFLELGGEYIDIYNFHYYGTAKPVGIGEYYRSGINIYNSMKSILEEYGYGDKPIWVTETCTFSGRLGNVIQTEDEQASDLVKRFVTMKTLDVKKVFWCYIEEPDYESGTDEGFFDQSGLIYDGRGEVDRGAEVKKKAYFAYKEMVGMLSSTDLVYNQDDNITYLSVFSKNNKTVSVLWQDKWMGNKTVRILGNGSMIVYSIYGEEISTAEDSIDLNLDIEPVYIIGDVEEYRYLSAPPVEHP